MEYSPNFYLQKEIESPEDRRRRMQLYAAAGAVIGNRLPFGVEGSGLYFENQAGKVSQV